MEAFYNIHGLVKIKVIGDESIVSEMELHLQSFAVSSLEDFDISVAPFASATDFHADTVVDEYSFNGSVYRREDMRIQFDLVNFNFYMDRLHLPINLIVQLALLKKGYTFVHAAALKIDDVPFLFPAYPGTGKTTIVATYLKRGAKLYGDDLAIIGKSNDSTTEIHNFPQAFSVYPHHLEILEYSTPKIDRDFYLTRIFDHIVRMVASGDNIFAKIVRKGFSLFSTRAVNVMPTKIFGDAVLATKGQLKNILVLERSAAADSLELVRDFDRSKLASQANVILWHEWHASFHDLLLYDALCFEGSHVLSLFQQSEEILDSVFSAATISKVKIPVAWSNAELEAGFPDFLKSAPE